MELEELTKLWSEMSAEKQQQKKLSKSIIIKMTQANYKSKINKVWVAEVGGALVCIGGCLLLMFNFQKLDKWYLQICGVAGALILVVLATFSLKSIWGMKKATVIDANLKETLTRYAKAKQQFVAVQKISFYLGAVVMLLVLPVAGKLMANTDMFKETKLWMYYALAFPFFYFFAKWVFKSYIKMTTDAERMLQELQD